MSDRDRYRKDEDRRDKKDRDRRDDRDRYDGRGKHDDRDRRDEDRKKDRYEEKDHRRDDERDDRKRDRYERDDRKRDRYEKDYKRDDDDRGKDKYDRDDKNHEKDDKTKKDYKKREHSEDDEQENKKQKNNSSQLIEQIQNMDQYQQILYFQQNPEAYQEYMQLYQEQYMQQVQYFQENPQAYQEYVQQYQEQYTQYQNPGFQNNRGNQRGNYQRGRGGRGSFQNGNNNNENQNYESNTGYPTAQNQGRGNYQNNRGNRGGFQNGNNNNENQNYESNTGYPTNQNDRGRGGYRGGRGDQNFDRGRGRGRGGNDRGRGNNDRGGGQMLSNPRRGEKPQPITLVTNFFKIKLPSFGVFVYHVDYDGLKDDKLSKMKALGLFKLLQETVDLGPRPLFDGKHTLFLLKDIGESQIALVGKKDSKKKQRVFLKRTNNIKIHDFELNEESTRVLEIFIKSLYPDFNKKGRGLYDPNNEKDDIQLQNSDLVIKKGVSFTFHPSESGLLLHSDITHFICIGSLSIDQWILYRSQSAEIRLQNNHSDISEIFTNNRLSSFKQTIMSDLKSKRFYLTHTPLKIKRKISDIDWRMTPRSCKFEYNDPQTKKKSMMSVEQYYKMKYNIQLQHGDTWPLIVIKKAGKSDEYYPLEVCKLEDAQVRKGNTTANEKRDVIANTKVDLGDRFQNLQVKINDLASKVSNQKDISLSIDTNPIKATGKVLPAPALIYKNAVVESDRGEWKVPYEAQLLQSTKFDELHICYPSSIRSEDQLNPFIEKITSIMVSKLGFSPSIKLFKYESRNQVNIQAQDLCKYVGSKVKLSAFFIVVMFGKRKNAEIYNCFKTRLELELSANTQFIMEDNVINGANKTSSIENLVAAINKKTKKMEKPSENWKVEGLPLMDGKTPTFFIGIDVNHGSVGSTNPSEAAISVSLNDNVTSFYSTFRSQDRCEQVRDLEKMLVEAFDNITTPAQNIIILRDGIANNQFETIGRNELTSLKSVINTHPLFEKIKNTVKVAFIIVQKRNSCKLSVDGELKIPPPGTTLNNEITGPDKKDFYLVSQKSPQGVARAIRYILLHDELKQPLEIWEELMYKLCYLHPGCTRGVSLPIPLYNSHKLAFRVGQVYRHTGNQTPNSTIILPKELKWTGFYF